MNSKVADPKLTIFCQHKKKRERTNKGFFPTNCRHSSFGFSVVTSLYLAAREFRLVAVSSYNRKDCSIKRKKENGKSGLSSVSSTGNFP